LSRKTIDANFPNGDGNGSAAPPVPVVLLPFLLPDVLVTPLPRWYPLTIHETSSIGREVIGGLPMLSWSIAATTSSAPPLGQS
jgi:hypothetical protein